LVEYHSFQNISTGYVISKFRKEIEDYYPFTKAEPPERIKNYLKDMRCVENAYNKLASERIPEDICMRTIHMKKNAIGRANDKVITFIHSGRLENFLDLNYRMPSINQSVEIISTKFFKRPSGVLAIDNLERKFGEEAREKHTTPLDIAFREGYVFIMPSGKILLSPQHILDAAKSVQNKYEII